MTNLEKFIEIFGEVPDSNVCPLDCLECIKIRRFCEGCSYLTDGFWKEEYKEDKM